MASQAPPAFQLPAALRSRGFALRPEAEDDTPFLMRLYASTHEELSQVLDWTPEQKRLLLGSQFQAQRHHYRTSIPNCEFDIIDHCDVPAGRLYLDSRPSRLYIVDIALLPEWRGQGIGTAILGALMAAGCASGRGVGIMVAKFNPALNLYRRLGFTDVADHGVYLELERLPKCGRDVS